MLSKWYTTVLGTAPIKIIECYVYVLLIGSLSPLSNLIFFLNIQEGALKFWACYTA